MRQLYSVALLLTLSSTSIIVPNLVKASYAQNTPGANQQNQKLLGSWEAKQEGIELTFIFAPDGKLFIMAPPADNQRRTAAELQYKVNAANSPMHLDVILPRKNQPVQTIFEYTADGKMRIQLEGTDPGVPRPSQFKNNGTIFSKISDSTALPEGVELVSASNSQQAPPVGVFVTATPKKANSPSYTGAVFATKVNGEPITISGICQTTKPTTKPSAMPTLSSTTNQITCPTDSKSIP